jgi:hypothetical protein
MDKWIAEVYNITLRVRGEEVTKSSSPVGVKNAFPKRRSETFVGFPLKLISSTGQGPEEKKA